MVDAFSALVLEHYSQDVIMLRLHLLGSLKRACFRCRMTVCNGLHVHALGLLPEARLGKLLQYPDAFLREYLIGNSLCLSYSV